MLTRYYATYYYFICKNLWEILGKWDDIIIGLNSFHCDIVDFVWISIKNKNNNNISKDIYVADILIYVLQMTSFFPEYKCL